MNKIVNFCMIYLYLLTNRISSSRIAIMILSTLYTKISICLYTLWNVLKLSILDLWLGTGQADGSFL